MTEHLQGITGDRDLCRVAFGGLAQRLARRVAVTPRAYSRRCPSARKEADVGQVVGRVGRLPGERRAQACLESPGVEVQTRARVTLKVYVGLLGGDVGGPLDLDAVLGRPHAVSEVPAA